MQTYFLLEEYSFKQISSVVASDHEAAFSYFDKRYDSVSKDNIFSKEELDQEIDLIRLEGILN